MDGEIVNKKKWVMGYIRMKALATRLQRLISILRAVEAMEEPSDRSDSEAHWKSSKPRFESQLY
jgi:hypothetical protein